MRKISIAAFVLLFAVNGFAQKNPKWIDVGVKGSYNPSVIFNLNILNDKAYDYKYSAGYSFGGKLGFNFNAEHQITVDGLYSKFNQFMDINTTSITNHLSYNSFDIALFYRKNDLGGGYVEIGPQYSMISNAALNGDGVSDKLEKANYAVMLGFGQYIGGNDKIGFSFGFRFGYVINDIINASSRTENGSPVYLPIKNNKFEYAPSNPIYAHVMLEVNWDLGYLVSSQCGKKTRFILFN
ncbi:MAG: hypothetical protein COA57_14300 [Flavobacteriales bacterium]|nr:MAG: hypothetical protein COA57_14300 [Flavobacteriales bacterium]